MSHKSNKPKKSQHNEEPRGNSKAEGEGQLYDKLMREHLQQLFLPLIAERLDFKYKSIQPLPDKQPTTIVRETDAFLLVETYSKEEPKFILHLEFESKDDKNMIYRMVEYHGIELKKYRLPIKHVVIYLGEASPKMRTELKPYEVFKSFTLVNARDFSTNDWINDNDPAKVIMAVLGDYEKKNAKMVLQTIINKLRVICQTDNELKTYIKKLTILSRMRKLEKLTTKISEEMPISINIEEDYLFKMGVKRAEERQAALRARLESKFKAEKEKLAMEKARLKAMIEAEKAKAEREKAKVEKEKNRAEREKAKAEKEKNKAEKERAELKAQIKADKKRTIQNMRLKEIPTETIMSILNMDAVIFNQYLKEIEQQEEE